MKCQNCENNATLFAPDFHYCLECSRLLNQSETLDLKRRLNKLLKAVEEVVDPKKGYKELNHLTGGCCLVEYYAFANLREALEEIK